jgi:hypothetical protein
MHSALAAPLLLSLGLAVSAHVATAQGCVHFPDANAATGAATTSPFGTNDANNLVLANQAILFKVPASSFPPRRVNISAIGFASEVTCTRHFGTIGVRFGHGPNPTLDPLFSANMPGFTNLAMQQEDWVWHTPANQWSFLGLDTGYVYDPTLGDLVIQIFVSGAWSTGNGPFGFHGDPTTPSVLQQGWRFQPGRGVVGTGAPKVRVCWDATDLQVFGGGCVGSNGLTPRLSFTGTAALGANFSIRLRDAAPTSPGGVLFLSVHARALPLDITGFGAPGCALHTFFDFNIPVLFQQGAADLPLTMPNLPGLIGGKLFCEWIVLDGAANPLGVSVSDFGRILIGS